MLRPAHARVDGNAAAGALFETFGRDMTLAEALCRHCGRVGLLAETVAEVDDEGVILLCRGCGRTLLTAVRAEGVRTVSFAGCAQLRWPDAPVSSASSGPARLVP